MSNERKPYPSETADKFLLRFPEGMREQIKEAAAQNNRTMNAEIIARLERSFSEKENFPTWPSEEIKILLVDMAHDLAVIKKHKLDEKPE